MTNIISNFAQVHSDLIGLKAEYMQQLNLEKNSTSLADTANSEAVQLNAKLQTMEKTMTLK